MIHLALLRLLESFFRRRWLYALPVVLMTVLAVIFIMRQPPVYLAYGKLYVQREPLLTALTGIGNDGFSWRTPAQATVGELNELLQTEAFVRSVIEQTDLQPRMVQEREVVKETIDEFREAVWIKSKGENLVEFGAQHEQPELAQQFAQATVASYVDWKINIDRQESVVAQTFFENLIGPYQENLDNTRAELQAYLEANPEPVRGDRPTREQMEIERLQASIDKASERLTDAVNKEENARLALSKAESEANQTYIVVDGPLLPEEPRVSERAMAADAAIFLVIGMLLSLTGVVGGALLDRSLRLPIDIRHGLELPVLAAVPQVRANASRPKPSDGQPRRAHQTRNSSIGQQSVPDALAGTQS